MPEVDPDLEVVIDYKLVNVEGGTRKLGLFVDQQ